MNNFGQPDTGTSDNRERPAPGDPEAPFYSSQSSNANQGQYQHTGYGPGPDMDPDGFGNPRGWQQPGWQPWARGPYYRRRSPWGFWKILLVILLIALLIKPVLHFAFALAGLGFLILLILLPFAILGLLLRHYYGWGRGWGRWGGPWRW